jgi:hypothetical protein
MKAYKKSLALIALGYILKKIFMKPQKDEPSPVTTDLNTKSAAAAAKISKAVEMGLMKMFGKIEMHLSK